MLQTTDGQAGSASGSRASDDPTNIVLSLFGEFQDELRLVGDNIVVGAPARSGAWKGPYDVLSDKLDTRVYSGRLANYHTPGMQAVHLLGLPDGRALIANGSANRDFSDTRLFFHVDHVGAFNPGVFSGSLQGQPRFQRIFLADSFAGDKRLASVDPSFLSRRQAFAAEVAKLEDFQGISQAEIQELIAQGEFPPELFQTGVTAARVGIDLFCGGHQHIPGGGDVLFISGTQIYGAEVTGHVTTAGTTGFRGNRIAWRFDWTKNRFRAEPPLRRGHWYPSVPTLGDGRLVVLSGTSDQGDTERGEYLVEVFDPSCPEDKRWARQDIENARVAGLNETFGEFTKKKAAGEGGAPRWANYPRVMLTADGRLMLTGDGVGPESREPQNDAAIFMKFSPRRCGANVQIALSAEPNVRAKAQKVGGSRERPKSGTLDRFAPSVQYGSIVHDPRSHPNGKMLDGLMVFSGQAGLSRLGRFVNTDTAKVRTVSDMTYWQPSPNGAKLTLVRDLTGATYCNQNTFKKGGAAARICSCDGLGGSGSGVENRRCGNDVAPGGPFDHRNLWSRMNHQSVILPTQQILLIGGGNYGYRAPVFHPVLLTPTGLGPSNWKREVMNPHIFPRLYHMTAILLPDARVILAGGNARRAAVAPGSRTQALDARTANGDVNQIIPDFNVKSALAEFDLRRLGQGGDNADAGETPGGRRSLPSEIHFIEVFEPPYLHSGKPRPEIVSVQNRSQGQVRSKNDLIRLRYGQKVAIKARGVSSQVKVTLVKLGATTHSLDIGQRLAVAPVSGVKGDSIEAVVPVNPNTAPPGVYMLFVVSDGVPSVAKMVSLNHG